MLLLGVKLHMCVEKKKDKSYDEPIDILAHKII